MSEQVPPPIQTYSVPPGAFPFRKLMGWVVFVGLAIVIFFTLNAKPATGHLVSLSAFTEQLKDDNVADVIVDKDVLRGKFATSVPLGNAKVVEYRVELPPGTSQSWPFLQWLLQNGKSANVRVETTQNLAVDLLLPLIPWLLIFAFIWFFVFRQLRTQVRNQQAHPKPLPVYIVPPENK